MAPALFSDRVYSGDDVVLTEEPQAGTAPSDFREPANPLTFDSAYVFHPDSIAARRALRTGRLPVWSPHVGTGRPLLANQQAAPLYPANGLAYVIDFWSSLEWIALLKLLIAGGGMMVLLGDLRLSRPARVFGAVSFMLSTYLLLWFAHPHSNVLVLAPWLVAFAGRTAARGGVRDAAALAAVIGLALLGGHPPTLFLLTTLLAGPYALTLAVRQPGERWRKPRVVARRVSLLLVGTGLGAAAGAVMLLPFFEALGVSADSADRGGTWLPARAINSFFFPELWGRPNAATIEGEPSNFQERTGYFGAAPLLLALGGLLARRPSQEQVTLAAAGLLALSLAFVPAVSEAVHTWPGFAETNLWRSIAVVGFVGTALGAYGVQRLVDGSPRERRRLLAVIVLAGFLIPVQWILRNADALGSVSQALKHIPTLSSGDADPASVQLADVLGWTLLALVAAVAVHLVVRRPSGLPAALAAITVVTTLELIAVGRGHIPILDRQRVDVPRSSPIAFLAQKAALGERSVAESGLFGPNLSNRWATNDARAHALPTNERYNHLWRGLAGGAAGDAAQRSEVIITPDSDRLLDVFAVRWVMSNALVGQEARGYRRVTGVTDLPVWENLDAVPRARVVSDWYAVDDLEQASAVTLPYPSAELLAKPAIEGASAPSSPTEGTGTAIVVSETETEVRLAVEAPARGHVVLSDLHYPGWTATVDGAERPVRAASVAFRAVEVPRGQHEVVFRYDSDAVRWGLVLSGFAWLGITAALVILRLRERRPRESEATRA